MWFRSLLQGWDPTYEIGNMKKIKVNLRSILIGVATGLIAGAALIMCAFSFGDNGDDQGYRVVQAMDVDGSYLTAEAKALVETDAGSAEVTADEELSEEEIIRTVEVLGADKDYLSSMTAEELKSLSSEALSNEGLDTSVADGAVATTGITFEIPEGFEADPDHEGMYVGGRYPIDASNMVYTASAADYTLQLMDKDYFEELVEAGFAAQYGTPIDVKITEYESYAVDGVPALRIKAEYDLEDNHMPSLMIIINGSETYTVVYTQNQDYDRMEQFEASAASIHVSK